MTDAGARPEHRRATAAEAAGDWSIRSWLYVPGDRPDRFPKALASGADAVVVDLEDAVAPSHKAYARQVTAEWLANISEPADVAPRIIVRINRTMHGGWDDLAAISHPALDGVRIPKAEDPDKIAAIGAALDAVGSDARVFPIIETCRGLDRITDVAAAHPRVAGLVLGEEDLSADLGTRDDAALDWARVRTIFTARARRLPNPPQSVFPNLHDREALLRDSERGRALGFYGRSAIHPAQLPTIHSVYGLGEQELQAARSLLGELGAAAESGTGGYVGADGIFVDAASGARANTLLERAARQKGER